MVRGKKMKNPLRKRLPRELKTEFGLEDYGAAIRGIHFPKDRELLLQARKRLVFDEFFLFSGCRWQYDHCV